MKYHAFGWQNVANDDARMLRPSVRRDVFLYDIVVEPRSLRAGQPADDAGRSFARRPDDSADGAASLIDIGAAGSPAKRRANIKALDISAS